MPLLFIVAAALATPSPGAPAERVLSVRVEAPAGYDAARLSAYLAIGPGDAFEPAAIRKTVGLLYATGRFRDVIVDATPGPAGVDLVIRPIPAPLLDRVVTEGDRIASPRTVARITRLRRFEPLWPARLDAAAQTAALAFEAQGYLEARVWATARPHDHGTDAVFRIASGPRVRVGRVGLEGAPMGEQTYLRALAPREGGVFRRAQEHRSADRMRAHLVSKGLWRAKVDVLETYRPDAARIDLLFRVAPDRPTSVEFRGARLPGNLQSVLTGVLRDGALGTDAVEQVSERIEESFRDEGYRDAFVSHREEQRDDETEVVYVSEPGPQARVATVEFSGFAAADLEAIPETRPLEPLVDRTVDEDVRRLERRLQAEGYASARVEADVPDGGGSLPVTFLIRPGVRTLIQDVVEEGAPAGLPAPAVRHSRIGEPYRATDAARDREALLAACRNGGYLHAEVLTKAAFSEDRTRVVVSFHVDPGPRVDVGRIVIAGLDRTRPAVVRRELTVKEGQPLSETALLESQRRLSALGIFDRATVNEIDPEEPGPRDLVVTAEEGPATTLAYGLGYAEQDRARGSLEITRRNVLGMDRTLTAFGRASLGGNSRVLATLREPYLFGRRLELYSTGFHEEGHRDGFDFTRSGGLLQTAFREGPHAGFIVRFSYQKTHLFDVTIPIDEIDRQFQDSISSGPSVSFVDDTRDDPLDPRRGRFLGADLQLSSKVFGGDSFLKTFFQASGYRSVLPRTILAASLRLGLAKTLQAGGPVRLPLPDRFFAGGDNSIRGFALDAVGPRENTVGGGTAASGGNALVVGSAELRIDVGRRFSVAVFTDAGNVYPLVSGMTLDDVRYTAGMGLRYRSALGPFRIDWGYKLNRRAGESPGHLHLTIGHAF
jgi:outer membrane protein insertion porin family